MQVVKDPLPSKGARISTHITLPGRYLVLLPTVRHFGVSRRIDDDAERERLLGVLGELPLPGGGLIVRTVGEAKGREEFESDLAYLARLWDKVRQRAAKVSAPTLLHQDLDLSLRVVRDLLRQDFTVLWVDGAETYERIVEFLDQVQPALVGKVKLFRQEATLFEQFGIEDQIEAALKSKVWLKSGGYIVINPTEALVAIDVNTGRFVGQSNLEDTVLQTNLEAVQEIVRQIRLRDLGGIIVIDLIDMGEEEHRAQVFASLEAELRKDRAKTKLLNISEFGLVEITRKRSRANLERLLTQPCASSRSPPSASTSAASCCGCAAAPATASCCCACTPRSRAPCSRRSGRSSTSSSARWRSRSCCRAIPSCTTSVSTWWRSRRDVDSGAAAGRVRCGPARGFLPTFRDHSAPPAAVPAFHAAPAHRRGRSPLPAARRRRGSRAAGRSRRGGQDPALGAQLPLPGAAGDRRRPGRRGGQAVPPPWRGRSPPPGGRRTSP